MLAATIFIGCVNGGEERGCGLAGASFIGDSGVGAVRLGAPAAELHRLCHVASDTTEMDSEAMPQRVIRVRIGEANVTAEILADSVWRVTIVDSTLRTEDGLGVGTPLSTLLRDQTVAGATGEGGAPFVWVGRHCGLSFGLDGQADSLAYRSRDGALDRRALQTVPGSARVERVLIVGCAVLGRATGG